MQRIVPHLWYDREAFEAAQLYTSLFPGSGITSRRTLHDTPSGDAETVAFSLAGLDFMAISAGPYFRFNPSVSLMVACASAEEVDGLWDRLLPEGRVLMPLDRYPFSARYGWLEDRYGLSWQLMLTDEPVGQKITPCLLFSSGSNGKAEEGIRFYSELFPDSEVSFVSRYAPGEARAAQARVNYAAFCLSGFRMAAMDNAYDVDYGFNEAFSFLVRCRDQAEIDFFWERLSADPEAEQCGWLKDAYGLSWQIAPLAMETMLQEGTPQQVERLTRTFLEMKKFDLQRLERAWNG